MRHCKKFVHIGALWVLQSKSYQLEGEQIWCSGPKSILWLLGIQK